LTAASPHNGALLEEPELDPEDPDEYEREDAMVDRMALAERAGSRKEGAKERDLAIWARPRARVVEERDMRELDNECWSILNPLLSRKDCALRCRESSLTPECHDRCERCTLAHVQMDVGRKDVRGAKFPNSDVIFPPGFLSDAVYSLSFRPSKNLNHGC